MFQPATAKKAGRSERAPQARHLVMLAVLSLPRGLTTPAAQAPRIALVPSADNSTDLVAERWSSHNTSNAESAEVGEGRATRVALTLEGTPGEEGIMPDLLTTGGGGATVGPDQAAEVGSGSGGSGEAGSGEYSEVEACTGDDDGWLRCAPAAEGCGVFDRWSRPQCPSTCCSECVVDGRAVLGTGVTKIGYDAFACNHQQSDVVVTSADLSKVEVLGWYAFLGTKLTSVRAVDAPVLTWVGRGAFKTSTLLMELDLPQVTSFGVHSKEVADLGSLKSVNLPKVTSLERRAFEGQSLTSVLTPAVTVVGDHAFEGCGCLESIAMPLLTYVGDYAYENSGINGYHDLGVRESQMDRKVHYAPRGAFTGAGVCAA